MIVSHVSLSSLTTLCKSDLANSLGKKQSHMQQSKAVADHFSVIWPRLITQNRFDCCSVSQDVTSTSDKKKKKEREEVLLYLLTCCRGPGGYHQWRMKSPLKSFNILRNTRFSTSSVLSWSIEAKSCYMHHQSNYTEVDSVHLYGDCPLSEVFDYLCPGTCLCGCMMLLNESTWQQWHIAVVPIKSW